ncbi:MAG: hypothetical protein CVV41_22565 [Candidatus Riflebacteria bacterium HGW-Riflebacteria-1]|jgi:hypothetical protein|nr:MAG: hypothetical protein CVV41_22565 [Candidatus Riflebacteria bacterium HGW-Riflebacteria-1]
MKKLNRIFKVIIAAGVMFLSTAALMAETVPVSENDTVSQLAQEFSFQGEVANHDPFKPVIVKKIVEPVRIERVRKIDQVVEPKKEVIPPLKLEVTGICGNDGIRQAIIQFENDEHIVETGQVIDGKFKVIDVSPDKLVVYSIREQRRSTFPLEKTN